MQQENKQKIRKQHSRADGFTLIDVAVIVTVAALLLTPVVKQIEAEYQLRKQGVSERNTSIVDAALKQYFERYDHFPCPADMALSPDDADYGAEPDATVNPANACNEAGDPDPAIGGVPFKELNIPVEATLDGFGNKLTYAISKHQTDVATFNPTGALTIRNRYEVKTQTTVTQPDPVTGELKSIIVDSVNIQEETIANAIYVLVSHGKEGIGAFTAAGAQVNPCNSGNQEDENCDGDSIFLTDNLRRSMARNDEYFDDEVRYLPDLSELKVWETSNNNPDDIFSSQSVFVGIGTREPEFPLDVEGNIRTQDGNTEAIKFCEKDFVEKNAPVAPNCFEANMIGGTGTGCASAAMTGIKKGGADCGLQMTAIQGQCNSGQYVTGIKPNGEVICGP